MAAVKHYVDLVLQAAANLLPVGQGTSSLRSISVELDRVLQLLEQRERHLMVGHPDPDSPALLSWSRLGSSEVAGSKNAGSPGRTCLQQPELPGVDPGVLADLAQIPAYQCEVVITVGLADAPYALQGVLVARGGSPGRSRSPSDTR